MSYRYCSVHLLAMLLALAACNQKATWTNESEALLLRADILKKHHGIINTRIDSLWDATTAVLATSMPDDFPPTDREIFLHARNADHIRMFMSFKSLSPEVQEVVNNAGKYDAMLAAQVRDLQSRQQAFEHEKAQFLARVEKSDIKAGQEYAEAFRKASGDTKQ